MELFSLVQPYEQNHLEVPHTLDVGSLILDLRGFIARRGQVKEISLRQWYKFHRCRKGAPFNAWNLARSMKLFFRKA